MIKEKAKTDSNNGSGAEAGEVIIPVDRGRFNRNLLITLVAIEVFLVIIDATINYQGWISVAGIRRMANIAREDGIGTWFMSVQTLFTGITIFLIYLSSRRIDSSRSTHISWLVLSIFFLFMASDDAAQIHERSGSAFQHYAQTGAGIPGRILEFFPSYAWQLVVLPVFAALGLFMLVFIWTRIRDNVGRAKLILALDLFLLAIFLDFMEGLEPESRMNIFTTIVDNTSLGEEFVLHFAKVIEEFFEMLAITLLFSMFFIYLSGFVGTLGFRFGDERDG